MTVVIPVFNRAAVVEDTLRSIEKQTLRPLKVILVDNNSTDSTFDVLNKWKARVDNEDLRVAVLKEIIPGAAAARNRGLSKVDTPYTMFFDSDDLMMPDHCMRAMCGFRENPGADIIGWDCLQQYASGQRTKCAIFYDRDVVWNNLFHGGMATQRYAARTSLFRRIVGGWDVSCRGWNDAEFGFRILLQQPVIVKLRGEYTVRIIVSEESITGANFSSKASVWEHALDLMESAAGERLAGDKLTGMRRMINLRRSILAGDYRHEGAAGEADRLMKQVQAAETSVLYRMFNRLAVYYRGLGMPGIARLLRPFFIKSVP